ncbi:MAG: GWxTD domain-containing protein, partial [Salinibacter sp.]
SVWRSGLLSLRAEDRFSVRLADAFIHHVYARKKENEYALATDAYRKMLKSIGDSSHTRDERERIARRLRQLALVLPDEVRGRAGLPPSDSAITWKVVPSVRGAELLAWWRSEDPLPGTRANELLRDHLRRVAHARTEFGHPNTVYGFDERGEIYVRLGPPDHNVSVSYTSDRLTDLIYEREVGVDVRLSEFPANEFWSYGDVDRRLYYIFVQEEPGGPFTIGTVEDLLPSSLRGAFGSSRRAQQRSVYALAVLRSIYRTFGPFHPDMARRYDEVANYLQYVRSGGLEQFPNTSDRSPSVFLNRTLSQHSNEDAIAARKRRKRAPRQLSTAKQRWERLPIAVRTARFLNDDGTTRTEVYWAPRAGAFVPGKKQRETLEEKGYTEFDDVLVQFTATQETAAYRDRVINRKNYRLTNVGGNESTIPAQTFSTQRGDSTLYHLGLQWDAYLFNAAKQRVGPKLKVATRRRDSLRALSNDPDQLEV